MSILSNVGKNAVAGAAPGIEAIIQQALSSGKVDAGEVAQQVLAEVQSSFDADSAAIFNRVDALVARLENLVGWVGELTKGKRLQITVSTEVVDK